jgi:hypothetical protein
MSYYDAFKWISCADLLPPEGEVVEVKNNGGARLRRRGNLWFLADGSMYVYYTPEYWRPIERR